jgi:ribonucleoside-diphosphate reductase alpha chain
MIYKRSYSRWIPEENRREEWEETVDRFADFFYKRLPYNLSTEYLIKFDNAIRHIRDLEIMPSMRAMWTAGPALEYDNVCGYSCAYTKLDSIRKFSEILYILMNGTGIGISVERQVISELPKVPEHLTILHNPIVFEDSKEGWAQGYLDYLEGLWSGYVFLPDLSKIRPKGARLKTFGGRASGPEPLQELLDFTLRIFQGVAGRKLTSEECSDICCKIAEIVIVGGVRRSAILLLTNPSDRRMRDYKTGEFWLKNPQRQLANVSACYTEKPDPIQFMEDFLSLMRSETGERAFVNRESLQKSRGELLDFGLNPCGEVILKDCQFCNLTEVVVRPLDTLGRLKRKIEYATIIGTLQATLSDFRFLGPDWKNNTEEDRLLGVSLTGIMDNSLEPNKGFILETLKATAREVNREWANLLGINPAKAVTCVKPSGTVSQLVNASSGIHPRFSKLYIRRVRIAESDPLCKFLQNRGVPFKPEVGYTSENTPTFVFEFPIKAPVNAVVNEDVAALDQLDIWLDYKKYYTDHNPSVTVFVREYEWVEVAAWIYENWEYVGGITLLPYDGGVYQLAPFEEISAEVYEKLSRNFPALNFTELSTFEYEDQTQGSREFACAGGACDV